MDYMHDLKDLLCAELEEYAENGKRSGKMSKADIEVIDTVLNSVKNIYKINMYEEESGGYSEDTDFMGEGRMYGTSYEGGSSVRGGTSYARGRGGRGRGRNARRDSMGRYSRDGGMSYDDGMSYRSSYARGGQGENRGGHGYSRDDAKSYMIEQIEEMMEGAEKPAEREALKRCKMALERA